MNKYKIKLEDVLGICDRELVSHVGDGMTKRLCIRIYITQVAPVCTIVVKLKTYMESEFEYHDITQAVDKFNSL